MPRDAAPSRPGPLPVEERDASLLGTVSDAEVARRWGLSRERVRQVRVQQNIPAAPSPRAVDYAIVDVLAGFFSDAEVAKETGISTSAVGERRRRIGRPSEAGTVTADLDARIREAIARHPDWGNARIAKAVGCASSTSVHRRRTAWGMEPTAAIPWLHEQHRDRPDLPVANGFRTDEEILQHIPPEGATAEEVAEAMGAHPRRMQSRLARLVEAGLAFRARDTSGAPRPGGVPYRYWVRPV